MSDSKPERELLSAMAAVDQLSAIFRDVWAPMLRGMESSLQQEGVSREITDQVVPTMFKHMLDSTK